MPHLLTATTDTFLKADRDKFSRDLPDSDKFRVTQGEVIEAGSIERSGKILVIRNATVNGRAVPEHIIYCLANQLTAAEAPAGADAAPAAASPAEPVESAAAPAPSAPKAAPSPAAPASAKLTRDEQKAKTLEMLAEGKSVSAIAKTLRIGRAFVKRWRDGE
ncbi:helix-turn-helix domain-containing protein [Roseomonas sp. F4]